MRKIFFIIIISFFLPALAWAKIPNDPGVQQWAYKDTGVYNAWNYFVGSSEVVVAIIDNGFDTLHPDLRDNLWMNKKEIKNNGVDDDRNGYVDDVYGWNFLDDNNDPRPSVSVLSDNKETGVIFNHGTIVAGIIGAAGNNNEAIAGINWRVKLMNLKVVGNEGTGSMSILPEAIYYAVDNGADVINISMVGDDSEGGVTEAVKYAYGRGVVVVAAAGNNYYYLNDSPLYPVCSDKGENNNWVLGVSAIDEAHHLAFFSNMGNDCIDITAPGINITSTVRYSPTSGLEEKYSGGWNGTSFATPMVSGAAALIKSIHPEWTANKIYEILLSTVHHTPNRDEIGYSHLFGSGLLQVDKAVLKAMKTKVPVTSVLALANTSSSTVIQWTDSKTSREFVQGLFKDLDQVSSCNVDGKKFFVTRKGKNFNILDHNLALMSTWQADINFVSDFVCGDPDNNDQLDVILSPKEKNKNLFMVFNLNGKKTRELNLSFYHTGARVDLEDNKIRVVYKKDNNLVLAKIDENFLLKDSLSLNNIDYLGDFVATDIDNDGQTEYVVGSEKNKTGYLAYFGNDGKLKRKFWAYTEVIKSDMQLLAIDFNQDKNMDIVSYVPGNRLTVWTSKSKKLFNWLPTTTYDLLFLAKN